MCRYTLELSKDLLRRLLFSKRLALSGEGENNSVFVSKSVGAIKMEEVHAHWAVADKGYRPSRAQLPRA